MYFVLKLYFIIDQLDEKTEYIGIENNIFFFN